MHHHMRKFYTPILAIVFITNYVLGAIVLNLVLNWYDTGRWDADGWIFMGVGGLISGCFSLWLERKIYSKRAFWPKKSVPFLCRLVITSTLWIAFGFTVGNWLGLSHILQGSTSEFPVGLSAALVIPMMTLFYSFLIAPIGAVVGVVNSLLIRWTAAFHVHEVGSSKGVP
jgi:hypothetical protein